MEGLYPCVRLEDFMFVVKQLEEENKNLKEEKEFFYKSAKQFREENEKLKERIDELEKCNLNLQERLDRKEELNKGYRKEIKDHQLYEEKLEHRIIEFEELLH